MTLKVADLFCGAGGFSEGFRQAGFEIVFGLDNWKPAVDTHNLNHGLNDEPMDILKIETPEDIDEIIPDTEILMGSPPCVAFSGSNKAGKAEKGPGLALIEKYLQIVAWKLNKPNSTLKYWVMENVPNSAKYTKRRYTFKELNLPGGDKIALEIKDWRMPNASDYGTPQNRTRFICGDYPEPRKSHATRESLNLKSHVTMKTILDCLSDPLDGHDNKYVTDPNYGFKIKREELTDHYYDTTVESFEWKRAKRLKEDHGYMGKMSFPENLSRTSRTIMATRSASTREAMILGGAKDKRGRYTSYRMPTIREIGCMMSFPITYQFEASNEASKYRLVGNAVCPLLSKAIGNAIREKEGIEPINDFILLASKPSVDLVGRGRVRKEQSPKKPDARYARHIPYMKIRGFRVELNNLESDFANGKLVWSSVLHQGSGKNAYKTKVPKDDVEILLKDNGDFKGFRRGLQWLQKKLPDADEFQKIYCLRSKSKKFGPDQLLEEIRRVMNEHYPKDRYGNRWVDNSTGRIGIPREKIPWRILTGLYALGEVVDTINQK